MVMNNSPDGKDISARDGADEVKYYKRDFWSEENLKFTRPHFRLRKSARLINKMSRGKERDLLDVGCGPATLMGLLDKNIHYHGIDIAIHEPTPNLLEADFLEVPIKFGDKQFDIVLAQGVFEYVGEFQSEKFAEISELLRQDGKFVVSYINFGHRKKQIYWPYSNVQSIPDFRESLARCFHVDSCVPVGHNWNHSEPQKKWLQAIQMHIDLNIPMVSPMLAPQYFFICSPRAAQRPRS
jgi:cyclopropane fatty-acyl-phospholipid synthase-like methyltransferase